MTFVNEARLLTICRIFRLLTYSEKSWPSPSPPFLIKSIYASCWECVIKELHAGSLINFKYICYTGAMTKIVCSTITTRFENAIK